MGVFNNFPYANFHELNADWIIEQVRKVMDDWEEYKTDMDLWKLGVDDQLAEFQTWFDNLDVQDEIRVVMNELIASGEFLTITTPQINAAVEAWLTAHITPTTPAVDNTLSISGAAADAKAAGDRISDLKEDYSGLVNDTGAHINYLYPVFESGSVDVSNYELSYIDSTTTCRLIEDNYIVTAQNTIIHLNDQNNFAYRCYYSSTDGKWYSGGNWTSSDTVVPNNYRRYVVLVRKTNWGTITADECIGIVSIIYPYTKTDMENEAYYNTFSLAKVLTFDGALQLNTGIAYSSSNYKISDFIPVKAGQKIYYNLENGTAGAVIAVYDSNGNYVTAAITGESNITIASDGFVRFCDRNTHTDAYAYFDYTIPDKIDQELNEIKTILADDLTGTDYMQTAITRITGQLKAKSDLGNLVVFGFSTDQHILDEDDTTRTAPVLRGLQSLSKLTHEYPYDFICLGGDACDAGAYATTLNLILDECITIQKPLYDARCPVVPITGNHDAAQNNANMTGGMLFNAHFKMVANSKFIEGWDSTHTNGYWDSAAHKIRFIFFDDTLRTDYTYAQRSAVLSGMLSSVPSGYKIVIFSHHVISNALTDTKWADPLGLQSIINPYASQIICCICGHSHIDVSETKDGILYIATTLAMYGYDQDNNRGTLNTETETAFDTFVIDQSALKIYALRYGHGSNRDWTYTVS